MASKEFMEKYQIKSTEKCVLISEKTGRVVKLYPPFPWNYKSDHEYEEATKNYELALERQKKGLKPQHERYI